MDIAPPPAPTGFFRLLERESPGATRRLMVLAALAGLGSALVLATINAAAAKAAEETSHSFRDLVFFALAATIAAFTERRVLDTSTRTIEQVLDRLRIRITDKLRNSELLPLDQVGRSEIFASVARDTVSLSQGVPVLLLACRSAIIIFFVCCYLAVVSLAACLMTIGVAVVGALLYVPRARLARREIEEASARENEFYDSLTQLLDGLREVKLHQRRSDAIFARATAISAATAEKKIAAYSQFAQLNSFSQGTFYVLMAAIVFIVPHLGADSETVIKCTAAILFLLGPMAALGGGVPTAVAAGVSARNIEHLEATLDRHLERMAPLTGEPSKTSSQIDLEGIVFEYRDERARSTFRLGPIDFTVRAGETIFLVGGNGSGKTTLLMVLVGLYPPAAGRILLDGRPVDDSNLAAYRSLFTAVFSEYHLFDRLYGLEHVSAEEVEDVLRQLGIADKTRYVDGRFEALALSSGQRKRLALAVALLEDRPILVFDEWAAEQDPEFRQHFYDDVLRQLKARGKTLIIVTHDDRYYHADYIDEVRKVAGGKLVAYEGARSTSA